MNSDMKRLAEVQLAIDPASPVYHGMCVTMLRGHRSARAVYLAHCRTHRAQQVLDGVPGATPLFVVPFGPDEYPSRLGDRLAKVTQDLRCPFIGEDVAGLVASGQMGLAVDDWDVQISERSPVHSGEWTGFVESCAGGEIVLGVDSSYTFVRPSGVLVKTLQACSK